MKEIIYNKKREEDIRKTDQGRILKIIDRWIKRINSTKKENRPTAVNTLREIRRKVKENAPK